MVCKVKKCEPEDFEMISRVARSLLLQREDIEKSALYSRVDKESHITHPLQHNESMIRHMTIFIESIELAEEAPDYQYIKQLLLKQREIDPSYKMTKE